MKAALEVDERGLIPSVQHIPLSILAARGFVLEIAEHFKEHPTVFLDLAFGAGSCIRRLRDAGSLKLWINEEVGASRQSKKFSCGWNGLSDD